LILRNEKAPGVNPGLCRISETAEA
jgi:hypothetical protein